ncbi:AraC family transcriptional regulator [Quatrionicoccus australiensis]|uniref:AraC family transcriptional regulator n=1 Tax=Quatrionicoccus australiensis TaxID=138118 RepID=UPI001CF96F4B|nr:AraC family transcriptional regulator [Quatrionicoccus australiensis]MCB4361606.1 AraC family transcriptional regulator [Quatrionicoccus australiensis]
MTSAPHLDRLSALLAGLAPRVRVARPPPAAARLDVAADAAPGLHLYLLAEGKMALELTSTASRELQAPCIVVCRADTPHALIAAAADWSQLICARAWLDGPVAALLLGEFAEPQVLALAGAESSLQHVVKLIAAELQAPRCGQPALLDRAGDILFIGLLRHLIAHPDKRGGLLNGLAEPRIARALVAIHARPQLHWTLETLAAEAGMSRTAFANTFRDVMWQTPGKYLAAIRLAIARRAVQAGKGLKSAARDAGYANTSALSRALARPAALQ